MSNIVRIVVWNVEWAGIRSERGGVIRDQIWTLDPDVVCICEGTEDLLPTYGYRLVPALSYGPNAKLGCHKVMLWSKLPWIASDALGSRDLPPGRFIQASTKTPVGAMSLFGICIPYQMANVSFGYKNKKPWEDHSNYLAELTSLLDQRQRNYPSVILGDFNQRVPRVRAPKKIYEQLSQTLGSDFRIVTKGVLSGLVAQGVNHCAVTNDLVASKVWGLPNMNEHGLRLSDHAGVVADLTLMET